MLTDTQRKLAEEHLGLAYYCAYRMWLIPIELEDRIGLASLGLVKAAEAWDPEDGTLFATFAARVMRNEIWTELRKMKNTLEQFP